MPNNFFIRMWCDQLILCTRGLLFDWELLLYVHRTRIIEEDHVFWYRRNWLHPPPSIGWLRQRSTCCKQRVEQVKEKEGSVSEVVGASCSESKYQVICYMFLSHAVVSCMRRKILVGFLVHYSTLLNLPIPQIPLCRKMLGWKARQLRHRHWLSCALVIWQDTVHW